MIAERPRDQDLSEMEEDVCEQEESNDEDESFLLKGKSPALASGTAIKASIDGPINILLTPLFLDAANRILESAIGSLAGQHPGSLLESIHHNSISHALNTAKKVQKKGQVNTTPSETKLTVILPQHSRVSFCLDPLDFESLKRGMNTSFNISEDMVQMNITTTIMAEGGVEEIAVSLGNGVEKMGSVNAARRKLARSLSKEYGSSPPGPKRKLTRQLSREPQSPAAQKHPRAKSSDNEGQNIGQGATSLVIRVDSFWNHVPTPPHPRREQTATLNDFNLLTTASPALDSWLNSASNLNFLFEKTMKSRHLRNIALMTYAMAESHESSFKPVLPQSKKYYSKSGEAINSDLSCQLILILWKYMIQMDEVEAEKSIGNEDLPAITTLETGARVLLRQWKANLQMLNPCLSTMNWNKQLEDSEIEMNKLGTLDSEGYLENSDGTVLDEFPSDGSALNGTRTSVDQSEHASMSGYNRGQIYSKMKYSMYDEFSDRKRSRNVSGMSSQGESGSKSANTSYTRLLNPQRSNTSASSIEGSVFATRTSGGHTYLPVTDLECVTELSMGSVSSDEDVEADERLSQNGDILINSGWPSPTSQPSSPVPIMSSSATQIGDIEVIFKPVLKYFNLNTRDKVSAIKQIVEVVGQLSVLFTLDDFEICITKTSSKAMKDKHTKKLSRGKTFHRRDSPAFSCQDISLRLAIQESLKESSLVTAADDARVASSQAGGNKDAEISGNIEVVLNIHFGTVLQVVNMAILRLIIQVAQVIRNFQRAKTDLMLKEYASTLPTEGEVMPFQSYLLGQSPQKTGDISKGRTSLPKSGYRPKSANQEDDLDTLSSKSGSEVMPQCWQTMYHLLNLYSDREEDRPHVYENPLFSVENETGDQRMFYRNRHTAESHSSGEESFAFQPPVRGSSSSIGLSLTCTLGVDEFCLLAELAGLHLEVEVFQIVLGVTAAQSLLNQAYPGFVKKLPDVSASLQSPSISAILSKTSKTELLTIGSLTIELPQLSGATSSQELSRIHITSLVCIPSIVLDVPLDISMLTDIAAEASKKLAFRIRQLQQAERSYKTHHNDLVPPLLDAADTGVSDHSGFDFLPDNRNSWIISTVAKINSISIQAALLPQLFTQYLIENTCCTFKWKDEGQIFATIPKHTLKFHAKNGETESSAEVVFPEISFTGDLQNPSNGSPDVPTGSRTSAKSLMLFKATLEVDFFNHNLRSTLLNYILILQKILAQELTVLKKELQNHSWPSLEDISSKSKTTDQPKKPLCLYTLLVHFKGLQLTACSPSSSAVRLEMGVVELELSNMKEDKVQDEDMTDGSIDDVGVDILIHAKALIELGLSLGTLVRNPVFLEAEPEFDEVAYFKTKIGLTNSPKGQSDEQKMKANNGDRSSGKQTFLVSLIKPVLFIQPHAVDKGLMVWMSYKGAYEQFIQQWKDGNDEGILLGAAPSTSSSQATLPLKRRRTVPTHTTFLFQLSVREVAICVPFVQMHQPFSSSGSKSDLENPAALIISLESSLVSAHFRSSLVTKGFFNAFCLRFTENFQVAMDDWLPDFNGDLYNACCVPHGSFEVGSKVDSVATDGSQGQWKVGFRWHMKGLDVKVDPSIGHYLSGLINTMTSIAGSEDVADLTSVTETQDASSNDALSDQEGKHRRPSTLKLKEEDGKKTNLR
ncbi:hypothetical protein BSL78_03620 [Apostichopus japonicus]|uniref:Uncharacterized protein n=1 Tax=Stichopus japonicus TaxID=307972 RepID=A0A2G8LGV1_STIJA|nr:hypothetical protein BSL78_03620 [Apostichopus japonicus]